MSGQKFLASVCVESRQPTRHRNRRAYAVFMDGNGGKINWSDLVRDLSKLTSQAALAARIGVSSKEVARWIKGEATPQGRHAEALRNECADNGINHRRYQGLRSVYAFERTFEQNAQDGPQCLPPEPAHELPKIPCTLWDLSPNSPLGIPACVLTANSRWITPFSKRGFDIFTYKTVRSTRLAPHPLPNLAYVSELTFPQAIGGLPKEIHGVHDAPSVDLGTITLANSFGMPSEEPATWQADLENTRNVLTPGQILVASVVGTAGDYRDLVADFVRVAKLAAEVSPDAIELNFSCPNVYGSEGDLYHAPEWAERICKKVAAEVPGIRLVAKIGYLSPRELPALFDKIYRYIDGIAAINTLSKPILSVGQCDEPLFPAKSNKRKNGGISGVAIKDHALQVVAGLSKLAKEKKPELMVFGMGGVSNIADVKQFINAGANCVQLCTAAMFDPLIAADIRRQWIGPSPQHGSRVLGDRGIKFTDANVALAFDRTIELVRQNPWPLDEVWASVENHWAHGYKAERESARESTVAPMKMRAEAPTTSEIKDWYLGDLTKKLNVRPLRAAKV